MDIRIYDLPVADVVSIHVRYAELQTDKKNGVHLSPEERDWMDFIETRLDKEE